MKSLALLVASALIAVSQCSSIVSLRGRAIDLDDPTDGQIESFDPIERVAQIEQRLLRSLSVRDGDDFIIQNLELSTRWIDADGEISPGTFLRTRKNAGLVFYINAQGFLRTRVGDLCIQDDPADPKGYLKLANCAATEEGWRFYFKKENKEDPVTGFVKYENGAPAYIASWEDANNVSKETGSKLVRLPFEKNKWAYGAGWVKSPKPK